MSIDLDNERIVWIDVESDGLSPQRGNKLLQVASIVTNGRFEEVGEPFEAKIRYTEAEVAAMREATVAFVRDMHDANGLWAALPSEGESLSVVEYKFLRHLQAAGVKPQSARLGGNSITLDRNFLDAFLPRVHEYLHYRSLDMSSIGGFVDLARGDIPWFDKAKTHDALDDIRESLAEARHYRDALQRLVQRGSAGEYIAPFA